MARRVGLGVVLRQVLYRSKRIVTIFSRRETISRRHYTKLKDATPRSQEIAQRRELDYKRRKSKSNVRPASKRLRSRVTIVVEKVRESMRRFKEMARVTDIQMSDLYPGTQMFVSRTRSNAEHHHPSNGLRCQL